MNPQKSVDLESASTILNQLSDGLYVTDVERRILYWNDSAERITGYSREEVIGRHCSENILCHVDRNDNLLCGKDRCPLHRAIVTESKSSQPIVVYAKHKKGHRVPTQVTVSPLFNEDGEVIGGVEVFRDVSSSIRDLERARRIQALSLGSIEPPDGRVSVRVHYAPQDLIGGDFYASHTPDPDTFCLLLADVMGHGISASLYTMYLRSLWQEARESASRPGECLARMNTQLAELLGDDYGFATVALLSMDLTTGRAVIAGGGHPSPIVFRKNGMLEEVSCEGFPLGLMPDAVFTERSLQLLPGDRLVLYTDGAIEVRDSKDNELGVEGFIRLLQEAGYPNRPGCFNQLEERILEYSNNVAFDDDLTLIEVSLSED